MGGSLWCRARRRAEAEGTDVSAVVRAALTAYVESSWTPPAACRRHNKTARLRDVLADLTPRAEVVAEAGGWSVFLSGTPIAAGGATLDEAIDEMVLALREYADDWELRLAEAPNHRDQWGLVQLVGLSDDDELRAWLVGSRDLRAS